MGVEWGGTQLEFPSNPKLLCSETLWAIIKSHTIAYMEYLHFYPLTWTLCEVCTIDIVCLHLRWENRSVINWLACIYMFNSWRVYLGSRSDFLKFQVSSNTVSVRFSHSVVSDSLRPHELQHTRPPRPSPPPGVANKNSISFSANKQELNTVDHAGIIEYWIKEFINYSMICCCKFFQCWAFQGLDVRKWRMTTISHISLIINLKGRVFFESLNTSD